MQHPPATPRCVIEQVGCTVTDPAREGDRLEDPLGADHQVGEHFGRGLEVQQGVDAVAHRVLQREALPDHPGRLTQQQEVGGVLREGVAGDDIGVERRQSGPPSRYLASWWLAVPSVP